MGINHSVQPLDAVGIYQRQQVLQILQKTGRGHIGSAFSIMEVVRVLYDEVLKFDPNIPRWDQRDRFILSKGHGCLALYIQLANKGFFPEAELWRVSAEGAMLGGHPEYGRVPGIEASTGSLGHGLPIGVGIALAARLDHKNFRTFVLIGDGECNEGTIWEAALAAGKHQLSNLVVILDYNKFQCYSSTFEVLNLEPLAEKWQSFGFAVREVNGHDIDALSQLFKSLPFSDNKPHLIISHSVKGKGISELENNPAWHHKTRVPAAEMARLTELLMKENEKNLSE